MIVNGIIAMRSGKVRMEQCELRALGVNGYSLSRTSTTETK
uniref:Uncharacterized protein n=1 Tax=Peronospora matthiolae TaxID=2874970 RepID=A0AAV1TMR9_9STRA